MQWPQHTDLKVNGMCASLNLLSFVSFLFRLLFHVLGLNLVCTLNYVWLEVRILLVKYPNFFMEFMYYGWIVFLSLNFNYIPVGLPVRAINRPGSQMLGANGRDSGSVVSLLSSIVCNN